MVKKIDGRAIAEKIKDQVAQEIYKFNGPRPNLAIILVGEREDSKLYVELKEKEGKKVGIDTHLYRLAEDSTEEELFKVIDFLNADRLVDGILIQLPLPPQFNTDRIIFALDPKKDVDGFHPQHPSYIISPVLAAVLACLEEIKFVYSGKSACIFYNSEIFGASLKEALIAKGLSVFAPEKSEEADILISALGLPHSVKKEVIKAGAVLIDIGTTKVEDKVLGDIDFADVQEKASYLTPVPGGIGPMTIAFLFKNVLEIFKTKR
jgi:methylenetetrahydrofolate dehydrogenase (NADP+)/methenyltetrahydrofolate cyclohydrolase